MFCWVGTGNMELEKLAVRLRITELEDLRSVETGDD